MGGSFESVDKFMEGVEEEREVVEEEVEVERLSLEEVEREKDRRDKAALAALLPTDAMLDASWTHPPSSTALRGREERAGGWDVGGQIVLSSHEKRWSLTTPEGLT